MKINRPTSTENIRPFLLFLVMMTTLSLVPMLSHGAVFWDDEMESTSSPFYYEPNFTNGVYAFDTAMKMSGTASIRVNFPLACDIPPSSTVGQCGGSVTRTFPDSASVYKRVYFRMSGSGPNATPTGLFQASRAAHTKMFKGQSIQNLAIPTESTIRHWWEIGCCGSKKLNISAEHTPTWGSTQNHYTNITLQDNRWYCIETHEVVNTNGLPNGIAEAWVDGVKVLTKTDIIWQRAGSNFLWREFGLMRQNGAGNFWWDRFAAGNTRIGCIGSGGQSDTTPPTIPSGVR